MLFRNWSESCSPFTATEDGDPIQCHNILNPSLFYYSPATLLKAGHLTSLSTTFFIYIIGKLKTLLCVSQSFPETPLKPCSQTCFAGCGEPCCCEVWVLSSLMESSLRVYTFHKPLPAAYFISQTLLLWLFLLFVLITSRRKPPLRINEL